LAVLLGLPLTATAHGPDPLLGGALWDQDQAVRFAWRAGSVPPAEVRDAIVAAAVDSNGSRASKAATFAFEAGSPSLIGYGLAATCGINGIACMDRSGAPESFVMWFREHGHRFDWGVLKWCQMFDAPPNGCYDVENVALDEFGHVQNLGHHVNWADDSDYLDAVVQTFSRTKPKDGWNAHVYGPCDVATLQLKYDVRTQASKVSTCLSIKTTTTLTPSSTVIQPGDEVLFSAALRIQSLDEYGRLKGNALSGRTVVLQRRPLGSSTWSSFATMAPAATGGLYTFSVVLSSTADWRASFAKPGDEGVLGSASAAVRVTVQQCSRPPCPVSVEEGSFNGGTTP
jgi:hypothetical protein